VQELETAQLVVKALEDSCTVLKAQRVGGLRLPKVLKNMI
jgi:hypothetical protein